MSNPEKPPGSIDFQLTDFDEARHALDLPPPGVIEAQQLRPDYWTTRRRSAVPTDRALTGHTMDWVIRMPREVRPVQLCERFPRVANACALAWTDPQQCENLMKSLLADQRGHRQGFPSEVKAELERLEKYRTTGA
jgi:hypothetical protein